MGQKLDGSGLKRELELMNRVSHVVIFLKALIMKKTLAQKKRKLS